MPCSRMPRARAVVALTATLFEMVFAPPRALADEEVSAPSPAASVARHDASGVASEGNDLAGPMMVGAVFSSGFFAFDLALQLSATDAFGPPPLVTGALVASSIGLVLSHVGVLALYDPALARDPRQRDLFRGLWLLGTSLGLLGLAVPSCVAITSMPLGGEPEDVAVIAPFLLAAAGLVGLVGGAFLVGSSASAPVTLELAVSPNGVQIGVRGVL
ncbi:MAG: hypothetical protein U0353_07510 [Sandaracinus sp.]